MKKLQLVGRGRKSYADRRQRPDLVEMDRSDDRHFPCVGACERVHDAAQSAVKIQMLKASGFDSPAYNARQYTRSVHVDLRTANPVPHVRAGWAKREEYRTTEEIARDRAKWVEK